MISLNKSIPLFLVFALFACGLAWGGGGGGGGRQGPDQGFGGRGLARGYQGGQGNGRGAHGYQGGDEGFGGPQGRNGRNGNYGQDKKYRSNLYNDDDVYGYDATYPNGEAAYINYKSKDARARRGPEFARTSRAYSRQGGGSSGNFDQVNEYRSGGGAGGGRGGGAW